MEQQVKTIEIDADIEKCYQAICDFESYPKWQDLVKAIKILDQDSEGRPCVVSFKIQAMVKKIVYALRYQYEEESEKKILSWTYVKGDLKNVQGSYTFEKIEDNRTLATYTLEIEVGFWVPAKIMHFLKEVAMIDSIKALKTRAESS